MSKSLKNKVYDINLVHLLCLIPLVLFSYYKNGYLVYKENYMSLFSTLEYLVIPVVIVIISYLFEIYYYIGRKKDRDFSNVINSNNVSSSIFSGFIKPLFTSLIILLTLCNISSRPP